jgi:hypothetical protein
MKYSKWQGGGAAVTSTDNNPVSLFIFIDNNGFSFYDMTI